MANREERKTRNERIAEMLASGEGLKDFYRFTAQNPHIDLHDACQIVLSRPKASICFYIDEWNSMGRRVTKNRKGISFYDTDGNKQVVFDLHDTHGDKRYRRLIFPLRRLLYGLDELNGTSLAESNRRDYGKILTGVAAYLEANDYFTEDERRNSLLSEGVAYSLYCKTGFPKDSEISLSGMPYGLDENARLFKEVYLLAELAKEDISAAYERRINTPQIIDDIEEETVSDEPVIPEQFEQAFSGEQKEPATTEKTAEQGITEPDEFFEKEEEPEPCVNPLYARYTVSVSEPEQMDEIGDQIGGMPLVEVVRSPQLLVDTFLRLQRTVRAVSWGLVALLGVVSVVVIGNTIRLTVFARRREITIMKYVGATNAFIRLPFFVEGMTVGILAGLLSSGLVLGAYAALAERAAAMLQGVEFMDPGMVLPLTAVWPVVLGGFLLFGILLGSVGTTLSMRKYLNV